MKRFMKWIMSLVLGLSVLVGTPSVHAEEKVSIDVWTTPQFMGVYSPDEEGADYDSFLNEAINRFNEVNPNVEINLRIVASSDRETELSVGLQTDTLPDVFMDSHFVLSNWAHEGVLAPLNDIVDDEAKEDIPQAIWDNVSIGDDIYMYPFSSSLGTLVYNADLFKEVGLEEYVGEADEYAQWSLEDYEVILETLKEKAPEGVSPMGLFALNNQGDTWNLNWLRMFGNQFWSEDGKVIVNEESGVKALQKVNEWRKAGYTNSGPESVSSNDINAMFQNGQIGVSFTNSILYNNLLTDMDRGTVPAFDARLALTPTEDGSKVAFTYILSSVVFNTGSEEEVNAAKEFVKFMSSDEDLVMASQQSVPIRKSVSDKLDPEKFPLTEANAELSEHVYNFSNNSPGYAQIRNALYPALQSVFTDGSDEQSALDSFAEEANQIIEKESKSSRALN